MSATETTLATTVSARPGPQFDCLTRILYFRGLGLVFLIAFLSLWVQIHGLIGQEGILPAKAYFKLAADKLGTKAYWLLPSLCWFNTSDFFLHMLCALGTSLSVILAWGKAPRIVLSLLWLIYLSLSVAGQAFLSFQWDTLLLEMSLCSWIYAPPGLVPDWKKPASTPMDRWLLWALSFKLMFLSGVTKLLSGDSSWHDGTALQFHYYTQPIPSWTAWHACQFPIAFHKVCLLGMFAI